MGASIGVSLGCFVSVQNETFGSSNHVTTDMRGMVIGAVQQPARNLGLTGYVLYMCRCRSLVLPEQTVQTLPTSVLLPRSANPCLSWPHNTYNSMNARSAANRQHAASCSGRGFRRYSLDHSAECRCKTQITRQACLNNHDRLYCTAFHIRGASPGAHGG